MFRVGRDINVVARKKPHFISILECQSTRPLQDHHPFIFILIVPAILGRCMSFRNYALDPNTFVINQVFYDFALKINR